MVELRHLDNIQGNFGLVRERHVLSKPFTKFITKSDRGTGLGLYISKYIIESHGGTIKAENNRDRKGATFTFVLPLEQ